MDLLLLPPQSLPPLQLTPSGPLQVRLVAQPLLRTTVRVDFFRTDLSLVLSVVTAPFQLSVQIKVPGVRTLYAVGFDAAGVAQESWALTFAVILGVPPPPPPPPPDPPPADPPPEPPPLSPVLIPPVLAMTLDQATARLAQVHLLVGVVIAMTSPTVPAGLIFKQQQGIVLQGSAIALTVSSGLPAPAGIMVPSVVGLLYVQP